MRGLRGHRPGVAALAAGPVRARGGGARVHGRGSESAHRNRTRDRSHSRDDGIAGYPSLQQGTTTAEYIRMWSIRASHPLGIPPATALLSLSAFILLLSATPP